MKTLKERILGYTVYEENGVTARLLSWGESLQDRMKWDFILANFDKLPLTFLEKCV